MNEEKLKQEKDNTANGNKSASGQDALTLTRKEYDELKEDAELKDKYWERLLRAHADFENYKKRNEKERVDLHRYGNEGLITDLLSIVDDFDRALNSTNEHKDFETLVAGVKMIRGHLDDLLKKKGVVIIESVGSKFDPMKHEAIMYVESDEHPDHTVIEEVRRGYAIEDRVIRPAVVKVSKKKEEKPETREQKPEK